MNSLLFFSDAFYPNDLGEVDPSRQPFARNFKTFLTEFLKSEYFANNLVHKVCMLEIVYNGDLQHYLKQKTKYNCIEPQETVRFKHDSPQPKSLDTASFVSNKDFLIQKDKNLEYQKLRKDVLIQLHQVYLKKLAPNQKEMMRGTAKRQTMTLGQPRVGSTTELGSVKDLRHGLSKGKTMPKSKIDIEIKHSDMISAMRNAGVTKLADADLVLLIDQEMERQKENQKESFKTLKDLIKNLFVNTKLGDGTLL